MLKKSYDSIISDRWYLVYKLNYIITKIYIYLALQEIVIQAAYSKMIK